MGGDVVHSPRYSLSRWVSLNYMPFPSRLGVRMSQLYLKALEFKKWNYSSQIYYLNRAAVQYRQKRLRAKADLFLVGQVRDPCSTCSGVTCRWTLEWPGRDCILPAWGSSLPLKWPITWAREIPTLGQVHTLYDPGATCPLLASVPSSSDKNIICQGCYEE